MANHPSHIDASIQAIRDVAAAGVASIDAAAEAIDGDIEEAATAARQELAVAVSRAHAAAGVGHAAAIEDAAHSGRNRLDGAARQLPRPTVDKNGTVIDAVSVARVLREWDEHLAAAFGIAEPKLRDGVVLGIQHRVGRRGCTLDEAIFAYVSEARRERQKSPGEQLRSRGFGGRGRTAHDDWLERQRKDESGPGAPEDETERILKLRKPDEGHDR